MIMTTAGDIIACARLFIGVRFAHQGRTPEGLDCLGLLILTAQSLCLRIKDMDVAALDIPHYGTRPDAQALKEKLDAHLEPVSCGNLREGDIVLLKIAGVPQHLALITDYPMRGELGMIHAYAPARQVIEHRYDTHWRKETYAGYRMPSMTDD